MPAFPVAAASAGEEPNLFCLLLSMRSCLDLDPEFEDRLLMKTLSPAKRSTSLSGSREEEVEEEEEEEEDDRER